MPSRRSQLPLEEKGVPRGVYCPETLWDALLKSFPDGEYKNVSSWFRGEARKRLAQQGNTLRAPFDYELKENTLKRLIKEEAGLEKMLHNEQTDDGDSAYDELYAFAVSLGSDKGLTKNTEQVLKALHGYDYTGEEPFSEKSLELFIQYFETVLKRRALQAELKRHRRDRLKNSLLEGSVKSSSSGFCCEKPSSAGAIA